MKCDIQFEELIQCEKLQEHFKNIKDITTEEEIQNCIKRIKEIIKNNYSEISKNYKKDIYCCPIYAEMEKCFKHANCKKCWINIKG